MNIDNKIIPMINIDKLHEDREQRINQKKEVYEEVLKKCHNRILQASKNDCSCFCFFPIPSYIYGIPLYDTKSCVLYLANCLTHNGFDIKYTHPNLLYISWYNKKNPKPKNIVKQKNNINKYKTINDYKPTGKLIYDKDSIDLLTNKTYNLLEN